MCNFSAILLCDMEINNLLTSYSYVIIPWLVVIVKVVILHLNVEVGSERCSLVDNEAVCKGRCNNHNDQVAQG
jgi:hypothetical protein